jgi:predicted alpha-1,2-mannosidase
MRKIALSVIYVVCVWCIHAQNPDVAKYVNPMIGTGAHGHTYPGPCMPFGMVQLSPDTRLKGWDGCSGYHYSDNIVYGFSHTHLSGTGCPDYGDILLMPTTGKPQLRERRYASSFSHNTEKATAGYYTVKLDKYNIKAELTVTERTGLHKYTFPAGGGNVILDLKHRDKVKYSEINISDNGEISGERLSAWWADSQYVFFVIRFSKPFKKSGIAKGGTLHNGLKHARGHSLRAYFSFDTDKDEVVYAKVGISAVSVDGARKNLDTEQPGWNFDLVLNNALSAWNKELGKIQLQTADTAVMRTFYTAFYHSLINPNLYSDVDGKYRGRDLQVHEKEPFNYYTVFSLWDTYRALHPLYNLVERQRNADMINTLITQYRQKGLLPIWELAGCETFCMTGYHAVPVIADAAMKGIGGFDANTAFEAMKHSATMSHREFRRYFKLKTGYILVSYLRYVSGWDGYQKRGYLHSSMVLGSVSKTLEYAYDDWCIAQMAKHLGKTDDYNFFIRRAANYQNLLDTVSGFMRPRRKNFVHHFNPYKVTLQYTEGNAWQYAFNVPHDLTGHIRLLGGRQRFCTMLDSLFTTTSKVRGLPDPDVTGLIGQYAHGNEPSHHIAYEYDYAAQPWKTQKVVRQIMTGLYSDKPDGLCGNDDCGQMSAWYVFSALGFYPVCPGANHYAIGSPIADKAVLHLDSGKTFTVSAINNNRTNVYIQSARLNGVNYSKSYLMYDDLSSGGELELIMGPEPNRLWGSGEKDVPITGLE